MLTQDQKKYLEKIPADKKVVVKPYDPKTPEIVAELVDKIHSVEPDLEVVHLGASSLGISGQGDIDLSVLRPKESFAEHKEKLKKVLGEPVSGIGLVEWRFEKAGHDISIYLADPGDPSTARQLKVQQILKNNPTLLKEYEELKESAAKLSYREYQRQKYEFYNKILTK